MPESVGPALLVAGSSTPPTGAPPAPPTIELAQPPPPALAFATTIAAVVIGREASGALLLRTELGTLALKTLLDLVPGAAVELRLVPGPPPGAVLLHVDDRDARDTSLPASGKPSDGDTAPRPSADAEEPAHLAFGSEIGGTLLKAASGGEVPSGTRLLLRIALLSLPAQPSPDAAKAPGTFVATVVESDARAATTVIETPLGLIALDRALALPAGASLVVERVALPGGPPAQLAPGGTVLTATVLPSPSGREPPQLAPGTSLLLRLSALPLDPPPTTAETAKIFAGVVAGATATETLVETPLGTLALDRRLALPQGTLVSLETLAATPPAATEGPSPPRGGWSTLDQALATLAHLAPDLAARLHGDLTPRTAAGLAGTLLFLLGGLSSGTWPGEKALAALDAIGAHALRQRLEGDIAEMRRLADPPSGDWRIFVLPLLDGAQVRPVRLYLRRRKRDEPARPEDGTRFVLDIDMSRLGSMQFDGLVRLERFDLVLRSHRPVTSEMRQAIASVFHAAIAASGLRGEIVFTTASRFAVAPLAALQEHVGISA